MTRTMTIPVNGTTKGLSNEASCRPGGMNALERLIQIVRQNDRLLARLETMSGRLEQARSYAADPVSNSALATALVEHARAGYASVLAQLRANRFEALGILRSTGHREAS